MTRQELEERVTGIEMCNSFDVQCLPFLRDRIYMAPTLATLDPSPPKIIINDSGGGVTMSPPPQNHYKTMYRLTSTMALGGGRQIDF